MTRQRVVFVSDLHLLSRRSQADDHLHKIHDAAARAETCILGGDIFDFRWSTQASVEDSVEVAVDWLSELVDSRPECHFHFILGNHDCHDQFVARLVRFTEATDNFDWHPHFLRLGDCVFLHGDVADKTMDSDRLDAARSRWRSCGRAPAVLDSLYDLVVRARIHKLVSRLAYPHRTVVRRVYRYIEHLGHGPDSGLKHVYFGHTHRAMAGYRYGGVQFFNCGAPMLGLPFHIHEVEGLHS